MAAPIKFGVGQSVLRKEDDALIRGKGRYTDDHAPSALMHGLMLRSPHAHAKFTIQAQSMEFPAPLCAIQASGMAAYGGISAFPDECHAGCGAVSGLSGGGYGPFMFREAAARGLIVP